MKLEGEGGVLGGLVFTALDIDKCLCKLLIPIFWGII